MRPHPKELESPDSADWMTRAQAHDPDLYRHSVLVSELCAEFSAHLKLTQQEHLTLTRAGLLHDIGKLRVSASLLQKPSRLTADEIDTMQEHAHLGYALLLEAGETDEVVLRVIRDHHERLDGTGYPRKLTAPDISFEVRMVTLCDVYAAITEPRPYTTAMSWQQALERMKQKRTRLDVDLLSAFALMIKARNDQ